MTLTPRQLTAREDKIFGALEKLKSDRLFARSLYRDGVPTPESYLRQPVRVLFVFREPNCGGRPRAIDMRKEVSDKNLSNTWWNKKVCLFAHATASALTGTSPRQAFNNFKQMSPDGASNKELLNRFAYIQIKKVGGGGKSDHYQICQYAQRHAGTLGEQIRLYRPHLVIGCGVGRSSPARLLVEHVLTNGFQEETRRTKAFWWRFAKTDYPAAMLQLYHPSKRGDRRALYQDVFESVADLRSRVAVISRARSSCLAPLD